MTILKYCKVRDVKSPERGTAKSAGIDFFVPNDFKEYYLAPGDDVLIPSGIIADIPAGFMLMAADKSGIVTTRFAQRQAGRAPKKDAYNSSIIVGAKIVDEDYQGEIGIHLINAGNNSLRISPGKKITQFILVPVNYAELQEMPDKDTLFGNKITERGSGGWGSTNK